MSKAQQVVRCLVEDDELDWAPDKADPDDSTGVLRALPEPKSYNSEINPGDFATLPHRVALHRAVHRDDEWVTHLESFFQGTGHYDSGHYFRDDYDAAYADYLERCKKYRLNPHP